MNKSVVIGVIVILVVLAGGGALLMARNNSNKNNPGSSSSSTSNSSMSNTPSTGSHGSDTTASTTNSVTIENFAFSPASITIKKGTAVTWANKDSATHTVTESDSQAGPNSGDVAPGSTYSFTFKSAGTFHYHCAIHPSMTGTVTVTE